MKSKVKKKNEFRLKRQFEDKINMKKRKDYNIGRFSDNNETTQMDNDSEFEIIINIDYVRELKIKR